MKVCRENIMGIFNIPSIITFLLVLYERENRASQIPKAGKNTPTSRLCIEPLVSKFMVSKLLYSV